MIELRVAIYVIFSIIVGIMLTGKRRPFLIMLAVSIVFTPLIVGLLGMVILRRRKA